ncbi:MAG TPA: hypothetical protein VMM79_16270 [Longimicrobiales bacterium]|nr:hypothetical protein [Longimicrobiales bacterium]
MRDFFVRRGADFGLEISVQSDSAEPSFDHSTDGHVLAFGGGKDSRLLLGALRELGRRPLPVTAGAAYAADIPESRITESISGVLTDRVMPALMSLGREFYFGSGFGDTHRVTPWHQYFDWASASALAGRPRCSAPSEWKRARRRPPACSPST